MGPKKALAFPRRRRDGFFCLRPFSNHAHSIRPYLGEEVAIPLLDPLDQGVAILLFICIRLRLQPQHSPNHDIGSCQIFAALCGYAAKDEPLFFRKLFLPLLYFVISPLLFRRHPVNLVRLRRLFRGFWHDVCGSRKIIVSERVGDGHDRAPETWFKRAADTKKQTPELGGAKKSAAFQPREWLGEVRELWATRANDALKLAGKEERIDHRSYAARGIEQIPTVHEGPNARQLVKAERLATDRAALTSEIREVNDKLAGELAEIRTQSDLAQKQLDLLMEEIERGALIEAQEQAAKERAAEAAIRAKREADREASKAEAARKAEEAKLIEPATTANAALVAIANRIEQGGTERVPVSRQEAAIFADAMFGVGISGRLHGQGRGYNFLKNLEDGGRLPVDLKGLANIEVSRTKTGFEYAITAIKDKVTEFVAYLRGAAASQLDWDTKVLKSRAKQIEQPVQSRKRETKNKGLSH
jgi:hypothetical protein